MTKDLWSFPIQLYEKYFPEHEVRFPGKNGDGAAPHSEGNGHPEGVADRLFRVRR